MKLHFASSEGAQVLCYTDTTIASCNTIVNPATSIKCTQTKGSSCNAVRLYNAIKGFAGQVVSAVH